MKKLHIKKGDTVYINTGDNKGKIGRVLKVLLNKKLALVDGVNTVTKSIKPNARHPQGGFEKKEMPIHISNMNLLDPIKEKPTRVGRKLNEKGKMVRFSKKSGEEVK